MNYGGFWIRFIAYVIDSAIVTIGFVGIMLLLGMMGLELAGAQFIYAVLGILYFALMQSSKGQATIGKALCGLKVGGPNGERISVARALGREAAKIISSLILMIGFVIAAFTSRKQALHDFVATTYVVRDNPGRVLAAVALAVLALFSPVLIVMLLGAGALAPLLGPEVVAMMGEEPAQVAQQQKPAAPQPPKPAAAAPAAAAKPAAEAPKPAPTTVAATPAAPAAATPATAPAKPAVITPVQLSEPPKSAPAPVREAAPVTPRLEVPAAPVAEAPAEPNAEAAEPKAEAAEERKPLTREEALERRAMQEEAAARAPKVQSVSASWPESKARFNDLVTAVLFKDVEAVNDLIAFGKWADKPDSQGMTPLMIAARMGDTAIAEALLKGGADPRRSGPGGTTAISIARQRKDAAMLGLLQGSR
jgi:uncharacterized RDD family membrane protein YckC